MPALEPKHAITATVSDFLSADDPELLVVDVMIHDVPAQLAEDVIVGLDDPQVRWTPAKYLYDAEGSDIYEEITELPEYYQTRLEAQILEREASSIRRIVGDSQIVELGSGSSTKTRILLDAWKAGAEPTTYIPIDISHTMLEESAQRLQKDYAALRVLGVTGTYEEALEVLPPDPDRLVVFLGGTLGNFSESEQSRFFFRRARAMAKGSHLLLGFDRRPHAGKPEEAIRRAYDDAAGVTARFNRNLLSRLNRELGSDFDPSKWGYRALYENRLHRVEMFLEALENQTVVFPEADREFRFARGERILTEVSRKFDPDELSAWLDERGFATVERWSDERDYFSLLLLRRK